MIDDATKRATLLSATLASFLTPFMGSAINVALPSIGQEFGLDAVQLSWVATSYLLAAAVFLVPLGRLADIHGRKRVFLCGAATFTIASLVAGLADSGTALIVARVVQGAGSAMIYATGVAMLTSVFPTNARGRVLGLNVAAVYAGLSAGPFVGGILTENLGWRSIFLVTAALGFAVLGFVLLKLRGEWAEARGEPFDLIGSGLYALSLVTLMLGVSRLPAWSGVGIAAAGAALMLGFVVWEARSAHPVVDVSLFSGNRTFAFSNLAALINYSATTAVTFLLSLYLQYIKALSPQQAGLVLIAQPVFQALFSPLAGRLSDRIEPRVIASTGMTITAVGLFLLIFITATTPLWAIVACLVLLGFGFALFSSPNMNAIMGSVERRSYGVASGMLGTMRLLGQMLSMGIATLVFALVLGRVEITSEISALFLVAAKTAFAIFALFCLGGIAASLARGNVGHHHSTQTIA